MRTETFEERIGAVRQFNRFFTRKIGVLREGLLHSPYTLTEARILFELGYRNSVTASSLCRELGLDPGYLSRILARLEQQGLLEKVRPDNDGRQRLLQLTLEGRNAFAFLNQRSRDEVSEMLNDLSEEEQRSLLSLCSRVWLERTLRGACSPNRGRFHQKLQSSTRMLLDR